MLFRSGRVEYHMTGPEGDQPHGYWDVLEVEPPHRILFRAGFANADGTPNSDMPINTIRVGIEEVAQGRTRMSIESVFPSIEAMEQVLAMGTEEGQSQAVSQIDAILAEETIQRQIQRRAVVTTSTSQPTTNSARREPRP